MKYLMLTILVLSGVAHAHPVVNDSSSLLCQLREDNRYPSIKGDQLSIDQGGRVMSFSRVALESFLFKTLSAWVDTLTNSNDPLFVNQPVKPLCLGIFNDQRGANAVAIGDGQIAFGAQLAANAIRDFDDHAEVALTYVLAHEFAHILQQRLGLQFDYGAPGMRLDLLSSKVKELHADCIAGYLLQAHGQIPSYSQDKVESYVRTLGDAHAVGDHGLPKDRADAFLQGVKIAELDRIVGLSMTEVRSGRAAAACGLKYQPRRF